jgi:hypothetical protein
MIDMRLGLSIVAVLASACAESVESDGSDYPPDTDDFIDIDTPPGNCSAGTSAEPCPDPGSSGAPEGGACNGSQQCEAGNACIAPFVGGEVGDFTCSPQCIALDDESRWCLDASACCEAGAVCSARGLCILPEGGLDGTGTGTGDGTTGTGTGSGSSGEAGTTESTGSDTGAATGTTGVQ